MTARRSAAFSGRIITEVFRMLEEGVWAEIKVEGHHLRLFSERSAGGALASVYDVDRKKWIAPSEPVDDIEQGKERALEHAKRHLATAGFDIPTLIWKRARAV
jgi:hypothetical protein